MSNNRTKITPKSKPSISNKAWAYISLAGALVAIVYAGLALQNQEEETIPAKPDTSTELPMQTVDSSAQETEIPVLNIQPDPSH